MQFIAKGFDRFVDLDRIFAPRTPPAKVSKIDVVLAANAERDEREAFPREIVTELAGLGASGICIPESFGGAGMDAWALCILIDELSRADASVGPSFSSASL